MTILSISDVHIKKKQDDPYKDFFKFLERAEDQDVSMVVLLGDIFDLMIGDFPEYLYEYEELFEKIRKIAQNKTVHFVEGNHDFHLHKIMTNFFQNTNFFYHKEAFVYKEKDYSILFCHGDDIEINNPSYKRYRAFIRSRFCELFGQMCITYSLVKFIGEMASNKSRERNNIKYTSENETGIREAFREASRIASKKYHVPLVVSGHSHVKDCYETREFVYLNNGFFPKSKSYLKIDMKKYSLESV